jgi:hypothetical protein
MSADDMLKVRPVLGMFVNTLLVKTKHSVNRLCLFCVLAVLRNCSAVQAMLAAACRNRCDQPAFST